MTLTLSDRAYNAAQKTGVTPQLALKIDGVSTVFGAMRIQKRIKIGDEGLTIGDYDGWQSWVIGGMRDIADQEDIISVKGTGSTIQQQLLPDKGAISSVGSITVELLDIDEQISRLISPGVVLDDLLCRQATLLLGFVGTAYPDDFVGIFGGTIEDISCGPASIKLTILHPEQKKRRQIFIPAQSQLSVSIPTNLEVREFKECIVGIGQFNMGIGLFFSDDIVTKYGLAEGQLASCANSANAANNFSNKTISAIWHNNDGYFLFFTGVTFVAEQSSGTRASFRIDANSLSLTSSAGFMKAIAGPDGTEDVALKFYARIGDEVFRYTGISGNVLTGVTRGQVGTVPAAHESSDQVDSFMVLEGDPMSLALKIMLSGWGGPFVEGIKVASFQQIDAQNVVANAVFFEGVDVQAVYGLVEGDFISTGGSTEPANSFTLRRISAILKTDYGSYVIVEGDDLSTEVNTSATCSFRSKYDTLPTGLKMHPHQVDVEEHERIRRLFLAGVNYRFFLTSAEEGKTLIETDIYAPVACYSLPRNGKCSVGIHMPPMPTKEVKTIDFDVIESPSALTIKRGTSRYFMNFVAFEFEESTDGSRQIRKTYTSGASLSRIKAGETGRTIVARGLRFADQGEANAASTAARLLGRYQFGAEYIESVKVLFRSGFVIEAGDIVLLNPDGLKLTNTKDGTRKKDPQLFEVVDRKFDTKTGASQITIVDTGYDTASRYGLIAPASYIRGGISETAFTIRASFGALYGDNEWKKWKDIVGAAVIVRSADFSRSATSTIKSVSANTVMLDAALGFVPSAGDIMELAHYDVQPEQVKLQFVFMSDADFPDGKPQYRMI